VLALLRQHGGLAPADDVQRREAIFMDHAEVLFSFRKNCWTRVGLKAEQDFQERAGWCGPAGQMKHMSTRRDHARDFSNTFTKRDLLKRPARHY
jgi:hypothetical protein